MLAELLTPAHVFGGFGVLVGMAGGFAALIGYYRVQSHKVWRESAEGWKVENEANKERADRLAVELGHTAAELKHANMKTDITAVLGVLQKQHLEATAILTRIADESAARNGQIQKLLLEHSDQEQEAWTAALRIASETQKTVAALKST